MASLPFRTQSFQKDNLPCVIMSICDLGQALVMHECHYRQKQGWHVAHKPTVSEETQSTLLLLLRGSKLLLADIYTVERLQQSLHSPCNNMFMDMYVLRLAKAAEAHMEHALLCVHKLVTSEMLQMLNAGVE